MTACRWPRRICRGRGRENISTSSPRRRGPITTVLTVTHARCNSLTLSRDGTAYGSPPSRGRLVEVWCHDLTAHPRSHCRGGAIVDRHALPASGIVERRRLRLSGA